MDPNAALEEIRHLLRVHAEREEIPAEDVARFFDLVEGLDGWLRKGGFLPNGWLEARRREYGL
jgi:hypothetical protein